MCNSFLTKSTIFSLILEMNNSNIFKATASAIFAIILLCFISTSSCFLLSERRQNYAKGAESSEIAYSSALLGGFKGVIADILWLRLSSLQSDNRILELLELSELITQLEPHIPEVWTFHAWNLSYNISLLATNKEDKWNWVKKGFELLRDKGLEINPNDPVIALELAWIFQHKIGTDGTDKNGQYFRTQWVKDISPYLDKNGEIPEPNSTMAIELEKKFKLNPTIMQEIENCFGKIDWRTPYAYSLYWGWIAKKSNNKDTELSSTRMVYTSAVKLIFDAGLIIGNPIDSNWEYSINSIGPNYALIPNTHQYIYESLYKYENPGIMHMFAGITWMGCQILVEQNQIETAQKMYDCFTSSFIGYNFPTMDVFISNQAEIQAFGFAIDEKFIMLNKHR